MGFIYMAEAGYDPREALNFWGRMAEKSSGKNVPEFLSTHPSDATRIKNLSKEMPAALLRYKKPPTP